MPFQYIIECLALGGVLTFSIIFLSLFLLKRNKKYIYLSGYFLIHFIALIVMNLAGFYNFSIDGVGIKGAEIPLLLLSLPLIILFFTQLLSVQHYRYIINFAISLVIASIVLYLFLPVKFNDLIAHVVNFQVLLVFTAAYLYLVKLKHELVSYFLAIVVLYFLCFIVNIFVSDWTEFNGSFLALSDWIIGFIFLYFFNKQTLIIADKQSLAENKALAIADKYQSSYKELLIQQEEDQEQLESRVQERTLELNIALQELEEANRELEQKNTLDELTGLFNRRHYDQKLLAEFRRSRRNLTPLSLVVIDIDYFKSVNDNYGHSAGDKCLVILGKLIKQILRRSSDIGCRYGGEEFCLILPETSSEGAIAFAQELRELVVSSTFDFDSTSINLTISCGICTYLQEKEATPVDIFDAADKALYQAKVDGRNQVQIKEINGATISPQSGEKNER